MMHNHRKELIQVNRARGLELISPDDLLLGAKALAEVNNEHVLALISLSELYPIVFRTVFLFQAGLPLQLHTFPTGVMVLRGQGVSQEEEKQSMVEFNLLL